MRAPLVDLIDPLLVERSITSRTRGVMLVHLYGRQRAQMERIDSIAKQHGLPITPSQQASVDALAEALEVAA